jgi:hypothetical protein
MRARLWLILSVLVAATLPACTPNEAFRKSAVVPALPCTSDPTAGLPLDCRQAITETTAAYDLHFVEFDDQGWTYAEAANAGGDAPKDDSSQQLRLVMERLNAALKEHPVRVFVYVHGWKHSAAFDDDNVVNFRDFLSEAAQYEDVAQSGNRVVGIYVGWRGKSLNVGEPWISATFWDRKTVAQHVAVGSVRELSAQLRAFQRRANGTQVGAAKKRALPNDQPVRIYMIGHSFGGLALYAAVSQSLVYGFVSGEDIDGKNAPVERLGDMIVLINPAFEATRFQPLDRAARNRKYDVYQAPVFVAITSDADAATGKLFPLGRTLNTIFESELTREERTANRNTPGHIDTYLTHRLALTSSGPPECNGWNPDPATAADMAANIQLEFNNSQAFKTRLVNERWPRDAGGKPEPRVFCGGLVLTPLGGEPERYRSTDPNMPLWNLTVSGEIIPGHNDINKPIFRAFLRQLFLDEYFNTRMRTATPLPEPQLPR